MVVVVVYEIIVASDSSMKKSRNQNCRNRIGNNGDKRNKSCRW